MAKILNVLPLLLLAGCASWATQGQHTLKAKAPATVAMGAVYTFTVDVVDASGAPLAGAHYGWMIDWPTVRGISHTGVSGEPQQMAVKGGPGTATLRLYLKDEKGRLTQADKLEFKVE